MWESSYCDGIDVDVQAVMDGLEIDRDGEQAASMIASMSAEEQKKINAAAMQAAHVSGHTEFYSTDNEPIPDDIMPPTKKKTEEE